MGFKKDEFLSTQWQPNEAEMAVPELKDWFDEGDEPVWTVRALSGPEVAKARHAKDRNQRILNNAEVIADIIHTKVDKLQKDAFMSILGNIESDADTAWRHELLILGTVKPENVVDHHFVSDLHRARPETYYRLTNKIVELIGQGLDSGKSKPFGTTKESNQD